MPAPTLYSFDFGIDELLASDIDVMANVDDDDEDDDDDVMAARDSPYPDLDDADFVQHTPSQRRRCNANMSH